MSLVIPTHRIPPEGAAYTGSEPGLILDLENQPGIRVESDVEYDFFVQVVSRELVIKGAVKADLALECSRCGQFFSTKVKDSSFLRAYELSGEDDEVDVTGDIREAILLYTPNFPLCKPACEGLCQQCGKDLNEGPCACNPPQVDVRWSELDNFSL